MLDKERDGPPNSPARRHRLIRARLWIVAAAAAVLFVGVVFQNQRKKSARALAARQEVKVRALLRDEPLSAVGILPAHDGLTGLLDTVGISGPHRRRAETAFVRVNPIDPATNAPARSAGQMIVACRNVPDALPAKLLLARKRLVPDPVALLGPYSAHAKEDFWRIKGVDFYTYGNLDVGIKDGVLVAVRVR